ncbi:MAG: hypothetical protein ACT4O1_18010 [Gemmatimonadota bacterium]
MHSRIPTGMPMTRTATPTAAEPTASSGGIPAAFHIAAAVWIAAAFALEYAAPTRYTAWMQEDRFVEWWTAALFAAAAMVRFRRAWRGRLIFDLLIAAFCLFVAGEEFSWGQRLLGFTPPDLFLEHNTQQEFTLHNFADIFGKPKGVLILALGGYGLVLPMAAQFAFGRRIHRWIGATPPALSLVPWIATAVLLLVWYPLEFTGEWVETMAGAMFLVGSMRSRPQLFAATMTTMAVAALLTLWSARGGAANPSAVACAERETAALLNDLVDGVAATSRLRHRDGSVHKRIWTAMSDGYLDRMGLSRYYAEACGQARRYVVDPWGSAYWIRVSAPSAGRVKTASVYSLGPNRRRDSVAGERAGDDIMSSGVLRE